MHFDSRDGTTLSMFRRVAIAVYSVIQANRERHRMKENDYQECRNCHEF